MEKRDGNSVQVQNEIAYQASRNSGNNSNHRSVQDLLQNVNLAVMGLMIIAGLLCLTMQCSELMFREALPAYLIVSCLLFFKATEQKS